MWIHPVHSVHDLSTRDLSTHPQQEPPADAPADTTGPAFDTTWATTRQAEPSTSRFEETMVSGNKIYVVLAVVLIIWFGLVLLLFRTDRRLSRLEQQVDANESDRSQV
jgi:CcmD family protein